MLRLRRLQSMEGSLPPPLLQNRACHFCGTRLLSDVPFVRGIRLAVADSPEDLGSDVSRLPLAGHRSLALTRGFSRFFALLLLITCPSPSSRQRLLGITPGLGFLRNPSPYAMRLAPAPIVSWRGHTGLLRSQFPWLTSLGRCSPPGFCGRADRSVSKAAGALSWAFWLQRVSLLRWFAFTVAQCTFACAARRCLRDGIPGVRLPGSAVYPRFRPLRTSRRPGGYAVTPAPGGRDLHTHGTLSYKVHTYLAVYLEASASFRPTGRTSTNAVLMVQPHTAKTCAMASWVPNTTRCWTPTRRRRQYDFTTCA